MITLLINQLLQINMPQAAQTISTTTTPTADTLSFFDLALKGGWVMIPIGILSLLGIYIFFDRYVAILKASKSDTAFMNTIKENIMANKIDSALSLCKATDTPISHMIEKGILRFGKPLNDISAAIQNVGQLEVYNLEKRLAILATVAGAAPMLGFLGTVTGMIQTFHNMSKAGHNLDISLLSGGIYEAMVTTVAGLIVGIIAYICYNILVANIQKLVAKMEARSIEFMDLLQEPVK
jgi:biopolymer transport protein ExbB